MTAKAKLVKTKRATVKRPRLWAVVYKNREGKWSVDMPTQASDPKHTTDYCADGFAPEHCARIIEIPPETLQ